MVKSLANVPLTICGQEWLGNIERETYGKGGTAALIYIDSHGDEIATLTVNLPELSGYPRDVVAIKDYSENEGVLAQLIKLGIVERIAGNVRSGFVSIPLVRILKEELL